jgi:hemerythrin superfamily protein
MNALEILKQDHQKVKELFQQVAEADDQNQREEIFNKIDTELEIHAHIEETVFYPALEQHDQLKAMVAEALAEHQEVKGLLEDIEEIDGASDEFESRLQILMESVEDHVAVEEREMFPKVSECFDEKELDQLGKQLESAKGVEQKQAS